jgi:hypothetical protein
MESISAKPGLIVIGPSTVGSGDFADPYKRKTFYANGRFWVFWYDGYYVVYSTSTDGLVWASPTIVDSDFSETDFSVWFDGTYLHILAYSGGSLIYRRGIPNADGTITWVADKQFVTTGINGAVAVDSYGYVWVGYRSLYSPYYPYVTRSGNNDGTWGTTPVGFPLQLSTSSSSNWTVHIVPLTNGKTLVLYAYTTPIYARLWNGSAWEGVTSTISAVYQGWDMEAVAEGDDVHISFLKRTADFPFVGGIVYVKYTYLTNSFGDEVTLQGDATTSPAIGIDKKTYLHIFWAGSPEGDAVYYLKGKPGAWTTPIKLLTAQPIEGGLAGGNVCSFYKQYDKYMGLIYLASDGVRFVALKL